MIRVAGAIGQYKHEGTGSFQPMMDPQFVAGMRNYKQGSLRFPVLNNSTLQRHGSEVLAAVEVDQVV